MSNRKTLDPDIIESLTTYAEVITAKFPQQMKISSIARIAAAIWSRDLATKYPAQYALSFALAVLDQYRSYGGEVIGNTEIWERAVQLAKYDPIVQSLVTKIETFIAEQGQ